MNYTEDKSIKEQRMEEMVTDNQTGNMLTVREAASKVSINSKDLNCPTFADNIHLLQIPSLRVTPMPLISALAFPYPEYLSPTYGTNTLNCWPAILHGYRPGIPHLPFGAAFDTIGLHYIKLPSFFNVR